MHRGYIHNFTVMGIRFVRRPTSEQPEEGTIGFIDNGVGGGWTDRDVGVFKNGEWRKPSGAAPRFVPAFWTVLDDAKGSSHGS